jgi:Rod binding domain-containing protein
MAQPLTLAPGLTSTLTVPATQATRGGMQATARAAAEDFEAVFLNTMFSEMFTGLDPKGAFGKESASGLWRSFQIDQYSRSFAKAGGIGIADQVYPTLLAQQEQRQLMPAQYNANGSR